MEVCSSPTIQTPERSAISAHSQWPTSKVIDNKNRACYRRGACNTNTPRTNRRNCRKSPRRPLILVFFVVSEQNLAERMPAVAISRRGAQSSPRTRTPNEDFQKIPGPYSLYPRISYRATYHLFASRRFLGPLAAWARSVRNAQSKKPSYQSLPRKYSRRYPHRLSLPTRFIFMDLPRSNWQTREDLRVPGNPEGHSLFGLKYPEGPFHQPIVTPWMRKPRTASRRSWLHRNFPSRSQGYIAHLDS